MDRADVANLQIGFLFDLAPQGIGQNIISIAPAGFCFPFYNIGRLNPAANQIPATRIRPICVIPRSISTRR